METRKLVKTGADTYTISLPKQWVVNNKLKKGDLLYVNDSGKGLLVTPEQTEEKPELKEISIQIDGKDIGTLRRETISAYINNYNVFVFNGSSLNEKIEDIRKILDNFLALEITEQTASKLVAKDYLNMKEFSLPTTIRRMDMIARSMMIDLRDCKDGTAQALAYRDYEVDKLFFLVSRLIRAILSETKTTNKTANIEAHSIWYLAKNIERIADCSKLLAAEFEKLKKRDEALKAHDAVEKYYSEAAKSYFNKDKKLADKLIADRLKISEGCAKLQPSVAEIMKVMVDHVRNIAKIAMDSE